MESNEEYFLIPKSFLGYTNFNEFISILEQLYKTILYEQSWYERAFIYGIVKIKKYLNRRFYSSMIKSKKAIEKE